MGSSLKPLVVIEVNIKVRNSIKSITYLYKYVYKGPDRVAMDVHRGLAINEVQ